MPTNLERAEWAQATLRSFQSATGADYQDALPDLLCDLLHRSDRDDVNFEKALKTARMHYEAECEEENSTGCLPESVRDLIEALEHQTEAAQAVVDSWERGDLAGAVNGLEHSLDGAVAALAKVKGGAA
jgi:hypothetical protein